jgi:hypothetical protein
MPRCVKGGTIVYKALRQDKTAPIAPGNFKWPVPRGKRPGRWIEVEGTPILCERGLHGWLTIDAAIDQGDDLLIYEMEVAGEIVYGSDKLAASKARLIRQIRDVAAERTLISVGAAPCRICGKPHGNYMIGTRRSSWADPDDGHVYDHLDTEEAVLRRLLVDDDFLKELRANHVALGSFDLWREQDEKRAAEEEQRERELRASPHWQHGYRDGVNRKDGEPRAAGARNSNDIDRYWRGYRTGKKEAA